VSNKLSAGILLYRLRDDRLQVLIGHPGGPFWADKEEGAWSIPKGLVEPGEDPEAAARREFEEETASPVPCAEMVGLGSITQRSGKTVLAWAVEGSIAADSARCNIVIMEWPRGGGKTIEFPEIDEFRWCTFSEAQRLLNGAQKPFLDRLQKWLDHRT